MTLVMRVLYYPDVIKNRRWFGQRKDRRRFTLTSGASTSAWRRPEGGAVSPVLGGGAWWVLSSSVWSMGEGQRLMCTCLGVWHSQYRPLENPVVALLPLLYRFRLERGWSQHLNPIFTDSKPLFFVMDSPKWNMHLSGVEVTGRAYTSNSHVPVTTSSKWNSTLGVFQD